MKAPSKDKKRERATRLALLIAVILAVMKLLVGRLTGAVSVVSEGLHSLLDVVSAGIAYISVREASKPADENHPFGHGKFETISGLMEALLLVATAFWIGWESYQHWAHPVPLEHPGWGMGVMGFSMVVSYLVYRNNIRLSVEVDSPAIQGNALHFLADAVTGLGVLLALVIIALTGWSWIDPLVALGVGSYILWIGIKQSRKTIHELLDTQLPKEEVDELEAIVKEFSREVLDFHDLRTRKGGSTRHLDFHLVLCGRRSVQDSHELCDRIEDRIRERFPASSIQIHVEPCSEVKKGSCPSPCPFGMRLPNED